MPIDKFQLDLPAFGAAVKVASFTGVEAVNEAYCFDVHFLSDAVDDVSFRALESHATLAFRFGGVAVRLRVRAYGRDGSGSDRDRR